MAARPFESEFEHSSVAQAYVDGERRIVVANAAFGVLVSRPVQTLEGEVLEQVLPPGTDRVMRHHVTRARGGDVVSTRVEVLEATDVDPSLAEQWFTSGPARLWQTDPAGVPLPTPFMRAIAPPGVPLHAEDAAAFEATFRSARESGRAFGVTARWLRPGGGYQWMHSSVVPRRSPTGEVERWLGCSVDVDDLMLDRRSLTSELDTARRRLAELDSFVATLAHEVAAPAQGLAETAAALIADAKTVDLGFTRKTIERLEDRSMALTRIIENLVSFSRLEAPRDIGRVKPAAVIEEVVRLLAPGRRMRVDVVPPLPEFDFSISCFQQVMTNLIAHSLTGGAKNVMIRATQEDPSGVNFVVDDDGPGIPVDGQADVAQALLRDGPVGFKADVGLAMVRKIVERSGGSVEWKATPGRGTVFRLRLSTSPQNG